MMRRRMRALAVVLGVSVLMTGCVREVPLVSEPQVMSADTLDDQLLWVEQQADAVIAATGIPEGWYWGGSGISELPWTGSDTDREPVRGSLLPLSCGSSGAGQLYLGLKNRDERADPFAVADRVRAFWESEGWAVTDVIEPSEMEHYFRADRADGATLSFRAAEDWLVLSVHTSCSAHDTVTNWEAYRDSSNPFQEELDRREQGGEG